MPTWFRRQGLLEEHTVGEMLGWDHAGGFSLDASVRIPAHDRAGLERLLRYCARPPFALNRIEWRDSRGSDGEGVVLYRLPRPAPDGRTLIRLSPLELLDRLAALVPPPRVHRHRYHGVLAPNSPFRSAVVAPAGETGSLPFPQATPPRPVSTFSRRTARSNPRRISSRWAALVARIQHARPLVCPECGGRAVAWSGGGSDASCAGCSGDTSGRRRGTVRARFRVYSAPVGDTHTQRSRRPTPPLFLRNVRCRL